MKATNLKWFFLPTDQAEFGITSLAIFFLITGFSEVSAKISLDVIPAASPEEYLALSLITLIHFLTLQNPSVNSDVPLMPQTPNQDFSVVRHTIPRSEWWKGRQCWFCTSAVAAPLGLTEVTSPGISLPFPFTAPQILPMPRTMVTNSSVAHFTSSNHKYITFHVNIFPNTKLFKWHTQKDKG